MGWLRVQSLMMEALVTCDSVEDFAFRLVAALTSQLEWDYGAVYLKSPTGTLVLRAEVPASGRPRVALPDDVGFDSLVWNGELQADCNGALSSSVWIPLTTGGDGPGFVVLSRSIASPYDAPLAAELLALGRLVARHIVKLQAREQLAASVRMNDERIARLHASDLLGVAVADATGQFTEANDAFLRMVGRTRDELDARCVRWDEITPERYKDVDAAALEIVVATGSVIYEKEFVRPDGTPIPVLIGSALIPASDPVQTVSYFIDLSKQADTNAPEQRHRELSARELQVLTMIGRGLTVKEIAVDLELSVKTISTYRVRLLEKMDLHSTAELMRYALRAGLVD